MPRRNRCVIPGVACHVTQRGVDRRETFSCAQDHLTYLRQLRENLVGCEVRLLGYCLMSNHVHLVVVPGREDSLAVLLRRVHGRYSQYYNIRHGRTGHLWQNRYFACLLEDERLWTALAYVERNPVRAGMVASAGNYRWSSAAAHLDGEDGAGVLDMEWWRRERPAEWAATIGVEDAEAAVELRSRTHAGSPFGSEEFRRAMGARFDRHWVRGRPRKRPTGAAGAADQNQFSLFEVWEEK